MGPANKKRTANRGSAKKERAAYGGASKKKRAPKRDYVQAFHRGDTIYELGAK